MTVVARFKNRISIVLKNGDLLKVIFQSFLLIFASEMGDKTQLLALVLTSRYKKPWTIMAGIFAATLLNHAAASWAGGWISGFFDRRILSFILSGIFFVFAAWILIPDKDEDLHKSCRYGVFLTTLCAFFIAEMGDKTQLATIALGAQFRSPLFVTIGTTAGMLAADGIAVFLGDRLTQKISLKWIRVGACLLFAAFGLGILLY